MSTVTCHHEGCGNAGVALELDLTYRDDEGRVCQISDVVCQGELVDTGELCGVPITDIKR